MKTSTFWSIVPSTNDSIFVALQEFAPAVLFPTSLDKCPAAQDRYPTALDNCPTSLDRYVIPRKRGISLGPKGTPSRDSSFPRNDTTHLSSEVGNKVSLWEQIPEEPFLFPQSETCVLAQVATMAESGPYTGNIEAKYRFKYNYYGPKGGLLKTAKPDPGSSQFWERPVRD